MNEIKNAPAANQEEANTIVDEITKAIAQIRHGEVTIIVQDSKVVQINKVEKRRYA